MIARIAAGLARSPAPEHRWRRVAVPVSALVFILLVLSATSVVVMMQRQHERVDERTISIAQEPSPTDLLLSLRSSTWNGEQFPVVWIEPSGGAKPNLPPGMAQLPEPGQAVVSPELDRLASNHPELAARYPDRRVLDIRGVRSEDELFAYVRMPEGRSLAGNERTIRVSEFVDSDSAARSGLTLGSSGSVPLFAVVEGVLAFLVVPGLIVLGVGLAAASGVRDHRFEVLRWLGAPRWKLSALAVLETLILALPSLLAATVLWGIISPRLGWVPLVGHDVVRGDLGLSWWLLAVLLGVGVVVTGLLAVLVTAVRRRRETSGPRPGSQKAALTPLRVAPLGIAGVMFMLGEIIERGAGPYLSLAGIVAAIAGVPLVLPAVLRAAGAAFGRLESVPASLAGRGMEWDPVRSVRPFAGAAALLVVALGGSGFLALLNNLGGNFSPPTGGKQAVTVQWLDPQPEDPKRLANTLDAGLVTPFRKEGNTLVVGATCRQLSSHFAGTTCSPGSPYELQSRTARKLTESLALSTPPGAEIEIRLVPESEVAASGNAFVLGNSPLRTLSERVRGASAQALPAPVVQSSLSREAQDSPLIPWIVGGALAAVVALAVGCLISLVDRLLSMHKPRQRLLNIGITPRQLTAFEACLFAVPFGVTVAMGFLTGLAVCAIVVGVISGVPMPWQAVGLTLVIAAAAGLLGTVSVALLGARSLREDSE